VVGNPSTANKNQMNITDIYVASPKMSENGSPVPAKNKIAVER